LNEQKRFAEAAALLATAEPAARKPGKAASQRALAALLTHLGEARTGLKQFEGAEGNLLEARTIWVKIRGEKHLDTRDCTQGIVDLYAAWHAAQPNKGYGTKAAEWRAKLPKSAAVPSQKKK
jgi:hypothetical protein